MCAHVSVFISACVLLRHMQYVGADVCLHVQCVCEGLTPVSEEAQCDLFSVVCVCFCVCMCVLKG